jgi:hypothetical protein
MNNNDYYSVDYLNKDGKLKKKVHRMTNDAGFVIIISDSNYIKFTHLKEGKLFYIEHSYNNINYVQHITGKCYEEWIDYLNYLNYLT